MKTLRPKPEVAPSPLDVITPASTVEVDPEYEGQRLDNFLSRLCRGVPRPHVYQLIRSGQVRINGARASADQRLMGGDLVRLPPIRMAPRATQAKVEMPRSTGPALPILFEDDQLLVVDKPAGLAVHGGSGISLGVIEALRRQFPEDRFLELVHRIDRETSGVLLIARRRTALLALQDQFRERLTGKTYLAVVAGRCPLRTRTLAHRLERLAAPNGDRRVRVSEAGREAVTRVTGMMHLELPGGLGPASLVAAVIETGRTHQIRVHLAHDKHPILGDDKYGDYALNRALRPSGVTRMYLHAHRLEVDHPVSRVPLDLRAPIPEAFARLMGPSRLHEGMLEHPFMTKSRKPR